MTQLSSLGDEAALVDVSWRFPETAMAHPETGQLVPACAQHSMLDVAENVGLRRLLPLTVVN